ncbi:hypothetical protein N9283_04415, partial [Akkermansiaceae bacterium]|nr:hypothetical protein [Akkermansiaceae bacterium]
ATQPRGAEVPKIETKEDQFEGFTMDEPFAENALDSKEVPAEKKDESASSAADDLRAALEE